jgi:hypothetical protein
MQLRFNVTDHTQNELHIFNVIRCVDFLLCSSKLQAICDAIGICKYVTPRATYGLISRSIYIYMSKYGLFSVSYNSWWWFLLDPSLACASASPDKKNKEVGIIVKTWSRIKWPYLEFLLKKNHIVSKYVSKKLKLFWAKNNLKKHNLTCSTKKDYNSKIYNCCTYGKTQFIF